MEINHYAARVTGKYKLSTLNETPCELLYDTLCTEEAARDVLETLEDRGQIERVNEFQEAWRLAGEEADRDHVDDRSADELGRMVGIYEAGSHNTGGF